MIRGKVRGKPHIYRVNGRWTVTGWDSAPRRHWRAACDHVDKLNGETT